MIIHAGEGATHPPALLTVKEAAEQLRVSRVTVWRWCQQGILPAIKIGRIWRISRSDLVELGAIPEQQDRITAKT